MLQLPNGCKCSNPSISPKNWKTSKASINKDWYIQYYFYTPDSEKGKLKIVKGGVNKFKTVAERRAAIKILLEELLYLLKVESFNPIENTISSDIDSKELNPRTPFVDALKIAWKRLQLEKSTASDLKSMMKYFLESAERLRYDQLYSIGEIRRKHIKAIFAELEKTRPLSEHRFNKYRSYLMMLFSEIVEDDAIESNPIRELKKRRPIKKIRKVLTIDERKLIAKHLAPNYPEFWTFVQIFFHSGGRMGELLSIRKEDVSLKNQFYKAVVKKGKLRAEVLRPIKTISLNLWKSLIDRANDGDCIFSVGLVPGPNQIRREQITRRWKEHVKLKLGITADIYSLKHSNLDEIARDLSIEAAAAQAGHTTPIVTMKYYAVGEKSREMERLKKAKNEF